MGESLEAAPIFDELRGLAPAVLELQARDPARPGGLQRHRWKTGSGGDHGGPLELEAE